MVSSVDRQHCVVKVGSLKYLSHILDFLQAQSLAVFKDDGLTDSFHTVLYQETVQVSVTRLIEVFAVYFCENKLYFKLLAELFRLAELKNCFFQVVVRGQNSYYEVYIARHVFMQGFDEGFGIVLQARLNSWHFE